MASTSKSRFRRELPQPMVDALNRLTAQRGSWWETIVSDPEIFIAIRGSYLNVYVHGNSLLRVGWVGNDLECALHHKFATLPGDDGSYIRLGKDRPADVKVIASLGEFAEKYARIKKQVSLFSNDERKGVAKLAARNTAVIDIEIAFSADREEREPENDERGADRIDVVFFDARSTKLIFGEAKLLSNQELVAEGTPRVAEQLKRYQSILSAPQKIAELLEGYRSVQELYKQLQGSYFDRRRGAVSLPNATAVDPSPRLIIFDFDGSQKERRLPFVLECVTRGGFPSRHVISRQKIEDLQLRQLA